MKMKVRGYDEHRLKDPYKFWSKLLDNPPKRKRRCIASYTYVSRIDESTLRFSVQYGPQAPDEEFLQLSSNNTWTITLDPKNVLPRYHNRMYPLTGVWVQTNKHGYSMHENHVRVYEGSWMKPTLPYEKGMQVYKGKVVDREKYVDRKRTVDKVAAGPVIDKLQKIYELAPIMIRLLQAHDNLAAPGWRERGELQQQLYAEFDPDNITALDAERVFRIGQGSTYRRRVFLNPYQRRPGAPSYMEEPLEEYHKRCVVNGLRRLREHVYSKEGVYQFKTVKSN